MFKEEDLFIIVSIKNGVLTISLRLLECRVRTTALSLRNCLA